MKKVISIVLCIFTFLSVFTPLSVNAGERLTIRILQEQLAAEQAKYDANQAALNLTQSEINAKNNNIQNLQSEMATISAEVEKLMAEIEKYKVNIKDKVIESRALIDQLQTNQGNNTLYYDYIFNAKSVSDMVYRTAVIKEIMEYNDKTVSTLNGMIADNEKREQEIADRKVEINNLQAQLQNELVSLGEERSSLTTGAIGIREQLEQISKTIKSYQKMGCKTDDVIGVDCAVAASSGVWRRPTTVGYVTQNAYFNSYSSQHRALDISSPNQKNEKIYPVMDGTITGIYYENSNGTGAKIVQMKHYIASERTYYTSLYVHLDRWSPDIYEGKYVSSNEYLGYMGNTGYSFGVHLHIELFPCVLYGDQTCLTWSRYTDYAYSLLRQGYNPRSKIPVTNGLYNRWDYR